MKFHSSLQGPRKEVLGTFGDEEERAQLITWEHYAHLAADAKLHGQKLPALSSGLVVERHVEYAQLAFFEGFGSWKLSEKTDLRQQAYDAGVLARIIYDDRSTFGSRIFEMMSQQPRRWFTVREIVESGVSSVDTTVTGAYLRGLVSAGYVQRCDHPERVPGRITMQYVVRYRLKPAKDRR